MEIHLLPAALCETVIPTILHIKSDEIRGLRNELRHLPQIDTSLQPHVGIITPDMERLIDAVEVDDIEEFDEALEKVLEDVDLPGCRLKLAQAGTSWHKRSSHCEMRDTSPPTSPQSPFSTSTSGHRPSFSSQ